MVRRRCSLAAALLLRDDARVDRRLRLVERLATLDIETALETRIPDQRLTRFEKVFDPGKHVAVGLSEHVILRSFDDPLEIERAGTGGRHDLAMALYRDAELEREL